MIVPLNNVNLPSAVHPAGLASVPDFVVHAAACLARRRIVNHLVVVGVAAAAHWVGWALGHGFAAGGCLADLAAEVPVPGCLAEVHQVGSVLIHDFGLVVVDWGHAVLLVPLARWVGGPVAAHLFVVAAPFAVHGCLVPGRVLYPCVYG